MHRKELVKMSLFSKHRGKREKKQDQLEEDRMTTFDEKRVNKNDSLICLFKNVPHMNLQTS